MEKNVKAKHQNPLLSIKEFSEISGMKQSTLRYWDEIWLFCPSQRNEGTGYRYYSMEQIVLAHFFRMLSGLNVPLKAMEDISRNRGPETILRLMERQEAVLDSEFNRLREAYSALHTLRNTVRQGMSVTDPCQVSVQALGDMPIAFGPAGEPRNNMTFHQKLKQYCLYAKENRINLNTPIGGYFDSMDDFLRAPCLPARFFSADPFGRGKRAAGEYIVGYASGRREQIGEGARRLGEFAAREALAPEGPVYVLYLLNEITTKEASSHLAQICVALAPPPREK